jgi:Lar family restriction alleviation protein
MNDSALLPCPFCGGPAEMMTPDEFGDYYDVGCRPCGVWFDHKRQKEAVRRWNTRVNQTTLAASRRPASGANNAAGE